MYEHVHTLRLLAVRIDPLHPEAGQDIYLAAAEHYLFAAYVIAGAPFFVKNALAVVVATANILGYESWKAIWVRMPSNVQQWIAQNLPFLDVSKASRPTGLSIWWGEKGVVAGFSLF